MPSAGVSAAICTTARSSGSLAVGNLLKVAQRKLDDDARGRRRPPPRPRRAGRGPRRAAGSRPRAASGGALRARPAQCARVAHVACEMPVTLDVRRGRAAGARRARRVLHRQRVADQREQVRGRRARSGSASRARTDALLVEIADDGSRWRRPAGGTGLRGLADRIDALGGRFEVDSPLGAGTRVSARLPLA